METRTPGIASSPSLRGFCALIASAIFTSWVIIEPSVGFKGVQNRTIVGLFAAGARCDQFGEGVLDFPQRFDLSLDVSDFRFGPFPHAVTLVRGRHAKRQQLADFV